MNVTYNGILYHFHKDNINSKSMTEEMCYDRNWFVVKTEPQSKDEIKYNYL